MAYGMNEAVRQPTLWSTVETHRAREVAFWEFHEGHPEVYEEFVRRCRLAHRQGVRFGARTIWEAMRWTFAVEQPTPKPYKMNNNHCSFYARLVMQREPEFADVFNTRGRR